MIGHDDGLNQIIMGRVNGPSGMIKWMGTSLNIKN